METPTISGSSYSSTASSLGAMGAVPDLHQAVRRLNAFPNTPLPNAPHPPPIVVGVADWVLPKEELPVSARIIKVFIADPNDNIPLDRRVLYKGDEKLTDLTDQELYFELPMAEILANHNAVRAKVVDKKASEKFGKDIFLDPIRIRDLKMVVVTIATF